MKNHIGNNQKKVKKIGIIVTIVIVAILALGLGGYAAFKSYIGKINIVTNNVDSASNLVSNNVTSIEEDLDEIAEDPTLEDTSQDEINALEEQIRQNMENNSTPIKSDKDVLNILLIGSDTRTSGKSGRSDAMIVVSINKKEKKIIATSILRDIYLTIPGITNNRINVAYAYGGADLLLDTIENNFKIEIDRYVSIDFYAFMKVVDIVGGITVDVTEKDIPIMNDYIKNLNRLTGKAEDNDLITIAGTMELDGIQTLAYVRNRYNGMDFARTSKQREVLEKLFDKVKQSNLIEINKILKAVLPEVTTNLSEGEIFSLILNLPAYRKYKLEQWSVPAEGTYSFLKIRGMDVIGIDFEENILQLQEKIYGKR